MLLTGLVATVVALGTAGPAAASAACPGDEAVPTVETAPDAAVALVCDLNAIRAQHGLKPLRWDWHLWAAAQYQALDMARAHYVSHTSSDGRGTAERVKAAGYVPEFGNWLVLENLAWAEGPYSSPLAIALGWMNSDSHRAKILDPEIEELGVGMAPGSAVADGPEGMFYAVNFGTRGSAVATIEAPTTPTIPTSPTALTSPTSSTGLRDEIRKRACVIKRRSKRCAKRGGKRARYGLCQRR